MIPDTDWKPSPSDIAWQKELIRVLTTRATWAVPGAMSVFEINKRDKKFKLAIGEHDDETVRRVAKVFKMLGFSEADDLDSPPKTRPIDFSDN